MFKSGFVAVLGRPNVGKSTLLNKLMGEKLSIVSSKPQTTRNNIKIILNDEDYQIIFVDTPGIHKPRHQLGEYMVKSAEKTIDDVDLILFLTTPGEEFRSGDKYILNQINKAKVPVFLVINKVDENTHERVAKSLESFSKEYNFKEIIPISALKDKNVDKLLDLMLKYLPEGPRYYPSEMIIDKQERFIVTEIIREKALRLLLEEVPHGIAVDVISMKMDDKGNYDIDAEIICEKDSHKGIIIGKNGSMIKRIKKYSKEDIENFFNCKVKLNIWVKVRKEWRNKSNFLKEFGYK